MGPIPKSQRCQRRRKSWPRYAGANNPPKKGEEWDPDMQGQRCQQLTKEGRRVGPRYAGQRYQQLTIDGRRVGPRYARSGVPTAYQRGRRVGPRYARSEVPTAHHRWEESGTQICKVRGDNSLPKKGEEWDPDMQGQR